MSNDKTWEPGPGAGGVAEAIRRAYLEGFDAGHAIGGDWGATGKIATYAEIGWKSSDAKDAAEALEARPAPADQRGEATEDPHSKAFFAVKDGPTLEVVAASPQSLQDARMAILNVLNSLDFSNHRLAKDFAYGALKAVYEAIAERAPRESAPSSLPLDLEAALDELGATIEDVIVSDCHSTRSRAQDAAGGIMDLVRDLARRLRGQEAV